MKKSLTYLVAGIAAVGLVLAPHNSTAQIKPSGKKYVFRIKWVKGQKFDYQFKTYISAGASAGKIEPMIMGYSLDVKSVTGDKASVLVTGSGAGSSTSSKGETVTIDSRGKTDSQSSASMFSNEMVQMPEKAVGIGESWSSTGSVNSMTGKMDIKTTNTFVGFKTEGSRKFAHVSLKLNMSGSGTTGTGSGDILYDVSNGMQYRATIKMAMTAVNPQNKQKMDIKVTTQVSQK